MTVLLIPVVLVALVVIGLVVAVVAMSKRRERVATQLHDADTPTLSYHVPEGQDPAVVLAALKGAGYTANVDRIDNHHVMIWCPAGVENARPELRTVIAGAAAPSLDNGEPARHGQQVRFADEA